MLKTTVQLEEDPETGDLVLPLSPDVLKQCGWDIGDTLLWEQVDDSTWSLTKKETSNEFVHLDPDKRDWVYDGHGNKVKRDAID